MIRKELAVFLVVGGTTVLVDYAAYIVLWRHLGAPTSLAKGASFLIGTVFAYFANKLWTFGHKEAAPGSARRFALLYTCTLGANVLANGLALHMLASVDTARQIAFFFATGLSATLNFVGMKFFVFRSVTRAATGASAAS